MALISANGMRYGGNPLRIFSGVTSVVGQHRRENFEQIGAKFNWFAGEHTIANVTDRNGKPSGARHPVAFLPPRKAGGLTSRGECVIAIATGDANLAEGRNLSGSTAITFTVADAQLELIVSASGTTAITFTATGNLRAALAASGTTSLSITTSVATLGAVADLLGTAAITINANATPSAIGHMSGSTADGGALTGESIASAVWERIVDAGYTAEEILRIIAAVTAGKSSGGPGSPVFRDLGDTKDRVSGTADADGNRSAASYDAT
jgi:hypothetical protein